MNKNRDDNMTSNIVYRKLIPSDVEAYHQIRLDCLKKYAEYFGTLYEEELNSGSFKFDRIILENCATDFIMGAFMNQALIGICGLIQERRQKTKHIGELSGMYVMPEFSGRSIGSGLLKSTIKTAFKNQDLEQIVLAVAAKNRIAQRL